mgnify:FL=1
MAFFHGTKYREIPTSIVTPNEATAGLTVAIGTAPINLAKNPAGVNRPVICYTYQEAVEYLGYSDNCKDYTLCQVIDTHFVLNKIAPVIFINVLDKKDHSEKVEQKQVDVANKKAKIDDYGVLKETVVVKREEETLTVDVDYTLAFDDDEKLVIALVDAADATQLTVAYDKINPSLVTASDIVGGVDVNTGLMSGLELVNSVFPIFRLVPGIIIAPKYSEDITVSAVMRAKSLNINSVFNAVCYTDADQTQADIYSKAPEYKNLKSLIDSYMYFCYGYGKLGDKEYSLSALAAALTAKVDYLNGDIPHESPSNKALPIEAMTVKGEEVYLGLDQANYLNSQGVTTLLNFTGGWKLWGNRTSCYPDNRDAKDNFLALRRMFNWVGNTLVLTFWNDVDDPTNKRLINQFIDSANIWLNGLTNTGALLGARVEFRKDENPITSLLDGKVTFHVFMSPPIPAEDIEWLLEFDVNYLNTLFE